MEKIEKIFDGAKGIIIFYIIVGVLALMLTNKIEDINSQAQNEVVTERTYYA